MVIPYLNGQMSYFVIFEVAQSHGTKQAISQGLNSRAPKVLIFVVLHSVLGDLGVVKRCGDEIILIFALMKGMLY